MKVSLRMNDWKDDESKMTMEASVKLCTARSIEVQNLASSYFAVRLSIKLSLCCDK